MGGNKCFTDVSHSIKSGAEPRMYPVDNGTMDGMAENDCGNHDGAEILKGLKNSNFFP